MTISYSIPQNICPKSVEGVLDKLFVESDAKYAVDMNIGHVVGLNVVLPIANFIFSTVDEVEHESTT